MNTIWEEEEREHANVIGVATEEEPVQAKQSKRVGRTG
jgi:hypothetical protein